MPWKHTGKEEVMRATDMANFTEIDGARKVLGLSETATLKEIKKAYRTLAHRHHPDKHSSAAGEETVETMKKLNWAYKLLMDYCSNYKYSFGEEDVARTYPYDEYLRTFKNKWFDSI
jgi:DnaJ-class molecular chaperone